MLVIATSPAVGVEIVAPLDWLHWKDTLALVEGVSSALHVKAWYVPTVATTVVVVVVSGEMWKKVPAAKDEDGEEREKEGGGERGREREREEREREREREREESGKGQ